MKIRIEDIPVSGLSLDLKEEGKTLEELAGGLDFSFLTPVTAHMDIQKMQGAITVDGDLKASLSLYCGRCLKEFQYDIDTGFSLLYIRGREGEKEKELKEADLEVNYLEGDELDTNEILLGQLAYEAPMQPLCTPDCKGLCPKCGADLNKGDCGCSKDDKTDSRFAKLKGLKIS